MPGGGGVGHCPARRGNHRIHDRTLGPPVYELLEKVSSLR